MPQNLIWLGKSSAVYRALLSILLMSTVCVAAELVANRRLAEAGLIV